MGEQTVITKIPVSDFPLLLFSPFLCFGRALTQQHVTLDAALDKVADSLLWEGRGRRGRGQGRAHSITVLMQFKGQM